MLGPGGVGGALAARLSAAGEDVTCVATPLTARAIRRHGLTLVWRGETIASRPEAVEALEDPVDLLLVTVKATDLEAALDRVLATPVVALPIMNGLEHVDVLRRNLGRCVAAGSVRIEAYASDRGRVVQESPFTVVRMASEDVPLEPAAEAFRRAGVEAHIVESEQEVLWEKAARLAVLAAATSAAQRPVGELRADQGWRATIDSALAEACAVATAAGVPMTPERHWAIIDSVPATLSTSAARDVATGRRSELDAVTGAVVRAGRRLGVATPTLEELLARCPAP